MLALLLHICLMWSTVKAQLSSEQEEDLSANELYINEFFKGFRMEEINSRSYTCLWEQRRMRSEFNYTLIAFDEEDEELKEEMFP